MSIGTKHNNILQTVDQECKSALSLSVCLSVCGESCYDVTGGPHVRTRQVRLAPAPPPPTKPIPSNQRPVQQQQPSLITCNRFVRSRFFI